MIGIKTTLLINVIVFSEVVLPTRANWGLCSVKYSYQHMLTEDCFVPFPGSWGVRRRRGGGTLFSGGQSATHGELTQFVSSEFSRRTRSADTFYFAVFMYLSVCFFLSSLYLKKKMTNYASRETNKQVGAIKTDQKYEWPYYIFQFMDEISVVVFSWSF